MPPGFTISGFPIGFPSERYGLSPDTVAELEHRGHTLQPGDRREWRR